MPRLVENCWSEKPADLEPVRFTQPIGGKFVLLHGRSLADKSKLALLSVLAVVAVNQVLE